MAERRPAVVVAVLSAAALAGGLVVLYQRRGSGGGLPLLPIALMAGALAVALLLVVVVTKVRRGRAERRPRNPAVAAAEQLGLAYQAKAEAKFHRRFAPLPGIPKHGEVRQLMRGTWEGRDLTIFQHAYHVHTGQAPIPVYHTVYVTDAPPWPFVTVTRRNLLSRMLRRLGRRRGLVLEEDEFNRLRAVATDDEDFAVLLLGPEMQRFLVEKPAVAWAIHSGQLAMVYNGALRPDRIAASLDRLRAFWQLVPAELEAWAANDR